MEYIDGEDLASLIKRIGHLSNEKALDIGRQLAAGLAAAHEKGVLHRDLKPANIMIDGHGRVRITDFGIAIAVTDEGADTAEVLGTPAYMAPEQLAGKGATIQTDIYSFGLVVYEIYSGKRAFTGSTIAELREQKEGRTPTAPSDIRQGVDPVVERLIMRCLDRDSRLRPASVTQVALALPGGDPLAAALAAGETPSPALVAASGPREGLRPTLAVAILAWVILGSILSAALGERMAARNGFQAGKRPEILVERAREFLRKTGYAEEFADSASGYRADFDLMQYIARPGNADRYAGLKSRINFFWFRGSSQPLETAGTISGVQINNPPMQSPGEAMVRLDTQGRLVSLRIIPPQNESVAGSAPKADWAPLFYEAGLEYSKWLPAAPERNPLFYADERAAWQGSLPEAPDIPVRIEAAAYRGKPVAFDIIGPWITATGLPPANEFIGLTIAPLLALVGAALFLMRRNLRLGRGDRLSATRLALFSMALVAGFWILMAHHTFNLALEFRWLLDFAGWALLVGALFWVFYIALEPFARRRWPTILVSWTRMLSGEWRDPLVGRDVLIGCGFGIAISIVFDRFLSVLPSVPTGFISSTDVGVARFFSLLGVDTLFALGFLCGLSFLRALLRNDKSAMLLFVLLASVPVVPAVFLGRTAGPFTVNRLVLLSYALLYPTLSMFVLMRFGLVALAAAYIVQDILLTYPMALHSSIWYSTATYSALAIIAVLALCSFKTSIAGRSFLDSLPSEE